MSLKYEGRPVMTDNPFIDLLVYNIKILAYNSVIKDQQKADENETMESLKESGIYLSCIEGKAELGLFNEIPRSFLEQVGVEENQIEAYERTHDQFYIPDKYHKDLTKLLMPWYIKNYVEKNEYYRMITGLPPTSDPGIPVRDYEYLFSDEIQYIGTYFHEVGAETNAAFEEAGVLDVVRAEYPEFKYLNYLIQDISLYEARNKLDFQILWNPAFRLNHYVVEEFKRRYADNREFMLSTVYTTAMELESEYYHPFMVCYLLIITMLDMITTVQTHIIKRDVLDRRCIEYIYSMYGVPYYKIIPYKYHERMCKNIYELVKYKSCTKDMLTLISLFGFEDLNIFKWNLLKVRQVDSNGEFLYDKVNSKISIKNDIVKNELIKGNKARFSTPLPQPKDLKIMGTYYANTGITNVFSPMVEYKSTNKDDKKTECVYPTVTLTDASHILKANECYIPWPFDYYLQKKNVFFVRLNGRVLEPGRDYTVHSYDVLRVFGGLNDSDTIEFDFYYDKRTAGLDNYKINKEYHVQTEQRRLKYSRTGIYDLNPIPIKGYFRKKNPLLVMINSVILDKDKYTIDYDTGYLTLLDNKNYDKTTDIVVVYVYPNKLYPLFDKQTVTVEQDGQDRIFVPEPFAKYLINKNTFFISHNDSYIGDDKYTITTSPTLGQSFIQFKNTSVLKKNDKISFHFLYSSNTSYKDLKIMFYREEVVATEDYQYKFTVHPPIDHYVESEYLVYAKINESWLPNSYYTLVGRDTFTFLNKSIALMKGKSFKVYFVYANVDRTKAPNIKVKSGRAIPKVKKQSQFDIVFPVKDFFPNYNKMVVDVAGKPLTEETDYHVDEVNSKIIIKSEDNCPSLKQRVNYTFFYNEEADYCLKTKLDETTVTKTDQEFFIPFPFYPYLETGHEFVTMVGNTVIDKSRITMTSKFTMKIRGLDAKLDIGKKLIILFVYNSWYLKNAESKMVVEHISHTVEDHHIDIVTPFDDYIENKWDWFVTYNNRMLIPENKFDVYNNQFYTYPVADLMNKVYGNNITLSFVYLDESPWVTHTNMEDYDNNIKLKFSKAPIDDIYQSQHMKTPTNWKDYDVITLADGWWDGRYYKHDSHKIIKKAIYKEKFNYARSKYYGIYNVVNLGEYTAQMAYFYSMLYDDVLIEKNVTLVVPSLSPSKKFNIAHLFIYMTILTYIFNELEDFVLDVPSKILYVSGFNFKENLKNMKDYVMVKSHYSDKDFPIWDMILPTTQIKDFAEFINIYKTNYAVRKVILKGMVNAQDYREYAVWQQLYNSLLRWKLNFEYFKLNDGTLAKTYTEFIKEKDHTLYKSIMSIKAIDDADDRRDTIIDICDSIIYIMEEYMKGPEFKYVFDRFPGHSASYAAKYLHMMIDFFKSYKIVLMDRSEEMDIGKDPNDPDNYMRPNDGIQQILCTTKSIEYMIPDEVVTSVEHFTLNEYGVWVDMDQQLKNYPVIDQHKSIEDYNELVYKKDYVTTKGDIYSNSGTHILERGYWMKEDIWIHRSDKDTIYRDIGCKMRINRIPYTIDLLKHGGRIESEKAMLTPDIRNMIASALILNKERLDWNIFYKGINVVMGLSKIDSYIAGSVACISKIFMNGYKMKTVYQPIYTTMEIVPSEDISDLNDRIDQQLVNYDTLEEMFEGCTKLRLIPDGFKFTVGDNMLKTNSLRYFAANSISITNAVMNIKYMKDDNKPKNFFRMFYNCKNLINIDKFQLAEYSDSIGDVDLTEAFSGCNELVSGITYIRSSRNLKMDKAFYQNYRLAKPPKIETMYGNTRLKEAFYQCREMKQRPVMVFGQSSATLLIKAFIDLTNTFEDCVNLVDGKDTSGNNVMSFVHSTAEMKETFKNCIRMSESPVINANNAVVTMTDTFAKCNQLKTVNSFTALNGSTVKMVRTYKDCESLKSVYGASDINGKSVVYMLGTFENCKNLSYVYKLLPKNADGEVYLEDTFRNCTSLKSIIIEAKCLKHVSKIFAGCTSLERVEFMNTNSTIIPSLNHATLDDGNLLYDIIIS